jgi:hypothetical protein
MHVLCTSRILLFDLTTPADGMLAGQRFPYGIAILNPHNLGGRFKILADQFIMHKISKVHLEYVPCVPATEAGSIVVYCPTDPVTSVLPVGSDEKNHAATYDNFFETQVWEKKKYSIVPGKVEKGYFDDEADSDSRLSVQGLLEVEAGSTLDASKTYGSIYALIECHFWQQALSAFVPTRTSVEVTIEWTTFDWTVIANASILAYEAVAAAGLCSYTSTTDQLTALGDDQYIVAGVVISSTGDTPQWYVVDEYGQTGGSLFVGGQGLFLHVRPLVNSSYGTAEMALFSTYDGAARSVLGTTSANPSVAGQFVYTGDPQSAPPYTGTLTVRGYYSTL